MDTFERPTVYGARAGCARERSAGVAGMKAVEKDFVDDGIVYPVRACVFDRFHRATDTAGGAGLGLAIADAIARATGGRWHIGSSAAGGASIAVSWVRSITSG